MGKTLTPHVLITGVARRSSRVSRSSDSSKLSTASIERILEMVKCNQTRSTTMDNYFIIWRAFNKFLGRLDDPKYNISWEECTALFGAQLVHEGKQSTMLKSYFLAIKHMLKLDGYKWDDSKAELSALIRGCRTVNDIYI